MVVVVVVYAVDSVVVSVGTGRMVIDSVDGVVEIVDVRISSVFCEQRRTIRMMMTIRRIRPPLI